MRKPNEFRMSASGWIIWPFQHFKRHHMFDLVRITYVQQMTNTMIRLMGMHDGGGVICGVGEKMA